MDSERRLMTLPAQMKRNKRYPTRSCIASCLQPSHLSHRMLFCFKIHWVLPRLHTDSLLWWSLNSLLWSLIRVVCRKSSLLYGLRSIDKIVSLLIWLLLHWCFGFIIKIWISCRGIMTPIELKILKMFCN